MRDPGAPRRAAECGRRRPAWPVWTGAVLLVVGLAALGWAAWTVLRPPVDAARAAAEVAALRASWGVAPATAAPVNPDEPVAILRVPALGVEVPVVSGTSDAALARGAGWYSGTVVPGEVGNLGLAAHGRPWGPLAGLETLQPGAEVVVETREATFTYVLDNAPATALVANTDFWVLDPVPGRPGERPTEALITLTTGFDAWSSVRRMVAFGHLAGTQPREDAGAARR